MRSGTSFFNSPLWKKNMTRFWPIWACYGVFWVFLQPLQLLVAGRYGQEALLTAAQDVPNTLSSGVFVSFLFGLFSAMAVFSYLFSSRPACMMHSLPMNRKCLFFTNYISGLSFLLLPNLAVAALTLLLELAYGCLMPLEVLLWLLVQSANSVFFFSFAVFCAMFTGNAFALPAFYGILNFLCSILHSLLTEVLSLLLYGSWYLGGGRLAALVERLTPVEWLSRACHYHFQADSGWYLLEQPAEPAIYAAVGLALTGLALEVYLHRNVESAGDVVAVPLVRPLFKYGVALCSGLSFGSVTAAVLGTYQALPLAAAVILWAAAGYFVAEMLLQKSFRVWKRWKGAAAVACLLAVLFTAVELDWFGYESRVPSIEQVRQVRLIDAPSGAPYDSGDSSRSFLLDRPDQISQVLRLHRAIVEHRNEFRDGACDGEDYINLTVSYLLTDGRTLERRYRSVPVFRADAGVTGTVTDAAQQMLNSLEYRRKLYGLERFQEMRLMEASLESLWDPVGKLYLNPVYLDASVSKLEQLWQAVLEDFEAGNIGLRYLFDSDEARYANTYTADLCFSWNTGTDMTYHNADTGEVSTVPNTQTVSITLTPQAANTLAVLERLGALDEVTLYTHQEVREMTR